MVWAVLVGAGLLEVVWAIALKQTGGFTRFWPSALGVGAAILSFVLLASALKSLPVGTAYAVGRSAPTTEIGLDLSDGSGSARSAWQGPASWRWARAPRRSGWAASR